MHTNTLKKRKKGIKNWCTKLSLIMRSKAHTQKINLNFKQTKGERERKFDQPQ